MRRIVTVTPHRGRSRSRRRGRLTTLGATVAAVAVAALACVAAAADESTTVGYVRVTVPGNGGVALIGLNFGRANGTGPLRAAEVFGGQLGSGDAPELADTLYLWNPDRGEGGGYDTVFQRGDGAFWDAEAMTALDPEIPTGTAVFVRTRLGTAERRIFLMGEVPDAAQQRLAVPAGLMALANPYAAALDLNQAAEAAWSSGACCWDGSDAQLVSGSHSGPTSVQQLVATERNRRRAPGKWHAS